MIPVLWQFCTQGDEEKKEGEEEEEEEEGEEEEEEEEEIEEEEGEEGEKVVVLVPLLLWVGKRSFKFLGVAAVFWTTTILFDVDIGVAQTLRKHKHRAWVVFSLKFKFKLCRYPVLIRLRYTAIVCNTRLIIFCSMAQFSFVVH